MSAAAALVIRLAVVNSMARISLLAIESMKYLKGEERVNTLLEIAGKTAEFKQDYLERALKETTSSRKILKPQKAVFLNKIAHHLRPIYRSQNNADGLAKLNKLTGNQNITPPQKLNCPLQKYSKHR